MKDIREIKIKRAKALDDARAINDKAANENRNLTETERTKYKLAMEDFNRFSDELKREMELRPNEFNPDGSTRQVDMDTCFEGQRSGSYRDEHGNEIRAFQHDERITQDRSIDPSDLGNAIVEHITGRELLTSERRAVQVDKSTKGGFLMSADGSNNLWDLARASSVVSQAGAVSVPLRGREMVMAKVLSDAAFTWAPELASIPLDDSLTFGSFKMRARKLATRIKVSDEMMKFGANPGALITRLLQVALAQEIDRAALVGSGAGEEPVGIANTTGIGTTAVNTTLTIDTVIDTVTALQAANVEPRSYITTPTISGYADKLKDGDGRYITTWPGAAGRMTRYTTSKLTAGTLIMGAFSDLVLCPVPGVAIDIFKDVAGGEGAWLIQVITYFDCGAVWPAHFHALTGLTTS